MPNARVAQTLPCMYANGGGAMRLCGDADVKGDVCATRGRLNQDGNLTAWRQWSAIRQATFLILSAASRDLLNPLPAPGGGREGIPEILCFVDDLAVAELHNTHCVRRSALVRDDVLRDPKISVSENPFDVEAGRLVGMMTPHGLQIASPEDSLPRLGIITNGIIIVNIVFRVWIAGCRRLPVPIEGSSNLFLLPRLLGLRFRFHVHPPCGMKPGTPVFTTAFSLCLV